MKDDSEVVTLNVADDGLDAEHVRGGSYTGNWNDESSREYKENVETLSAEEALEAFQGLSPLKYNYKTHKEEARLGFTAEDVPDLVAMKDRKNLSTMDLMAVLTKVVQEQQETIPNSTREFQSLREGSTQSLLSRPSS